MTDAMTNFLRIKRRSVGLTQRELAAKMGITHQLVSLWEGGQCWPGPELIPPLALILGMRPETFARRLESERRRATVPA